MEKVIIFSLGILFGGSGIYIISIAVYLMLYASGVIKN
jgi:hypothetical protein